MKSFDISFVLLSGPAGEADPAELPPHPCRPQVACPAAGTLYRENDL
jgi:hypothetical protein